MNRPAPATDGRRSDPDARVKDPAATRSMQPGAATRMLPEPYIRLRLWPEGDGLDTAALRFDAAVIRLASGL